MAQTTYNPPPDCGLDLAYCDESLLVVNKPAGLLSVPGRGIDKSDNLTLRVQKKFPDARSVHRLDMSTSGLLVFARGADMHRRLSCLFRERAVKKSYMAIVSERVMSTAGEIDLPLASDWLNRPRQKVDFAIGKPSLTRYSLLDYLKYPAHVCGQQGGCGLSASRIELEPVTGRTHQLRVHMAAIGHPVLGDELYGNNVGNYTDRLLLHARELIFIHPLNGNLLTLTSKAPF